MTPLVRKALSKADKIRRQFGLNMFQPINVIDVCIELGLTVRFLDVNMEGMYVVQKNRSHPQILISSLRPLPRRNYTCAHEFGHHLFEHGNKMDGLSENPQSALYDADEFLVDTFAGALLMPVAGIQFEFATRNWQPENGTPTQFFIISSIFGTGYRTLITHCKFNNIIKEEKAKSLLKSTPAKILEDILGSDAKHSHFKIIDNKYQLKTIDLEVSNYIFLPSNMEIEGEQLKKIKDTSYGRAYIAEKPGISRAASSIDNDVAFFIRIQRLNYAGIADYRHLQDENN